MGWYPDNVLVAIGFGLLLFGYCSKSHLHHTCYCFIMLLLCSLVLSYIMLEIEFKLAYILRRFSPVKIINVQTPN